MSYVPRRRGESHERAGTGRAREALRVQVGAARLHARGARGHGHRAGRAERRRQDHAAAARGGPDPPERRQRRRPRALAAARRARAAPARGLRRPGAPAASRLHDRRDAAPRPRAQPALGRRARAGADRAARAGARSAGREALGRPAGARGPDARPGQAAGAAAARRAGRLAGPARPPGVPDHAHGGRQRGRDHGRPLVAHPRRPRARVRPPGHPVPRADPARRPDRRRRGEPQGSHRAAHGPGHRRARAPGDPREPHRAPDAAARARERTRLRRLLGDPPRRPGGDRARLPGIRAGPSAARGGGGMIWVGWRQQRTETLLAAALLAALTALLIPTGLNMASAYDHGGLARCVGHTYGGGACGAAVDAFVQRFGKLGDLLDWVTLVPGIIGILLAAPFVAALEQRTHRLDWTQSITRRRWVAGKLGLAIVTALVAAV